MAIALGKLIRLLEAEKSDNWVRFDFGGFMPDRIASYRGDYSQLAIGYKEPKEPYKTVDVFLAELRAVNGQTMQGYKGGDFVMDLDTPIWVANYGESNSTAVKGLADCFWMTVIATEFED